jgi:hypothetical protein
MKRTIFSLLFTLFALAVFSQAPDLGAKRPDGVGVVHD